MANKIFNKVAMLSAVIALITILSVNSYADYSSNELVKEFIDEMVAEENFDRDSLQQLFAAVEKKQSIIDAMNRPAERTLTWGKYRNIFLQESRIAGGVKFWRENAEVLAAAEARALLLILVKEGIAIADKIAKTATTTTSSIRENPSSPGFLDKAFLALGLFKYACNGVIFKK